MTVRIDIERERYLKKLALDKGLKNKSEALRYLIDQHQTQTGEYKLLLSLITKMIRQDKKILEGVLELAKEDMDFNVIQQLKEMNS